MAAVTTIKKLMELGKKFGVEKDADFIATAKTYAEEAQLIYEMRKKLKADGLTVNKEYVKGRQNVAAHPLIAEIPKHVDCANRLMTTLMNIFVTKGMVKPEKDELDEFRLNA